MHILDQDAPGLAERLRALRLDVRQAIFVKACISATASLKNMDSETAEFVDALRSRRELSKNQAAAALSLSEAADDRYLALLQRSAPTKERLADFSKARLLKSMAIMFGAVPGEGVADAVYELTKIQDDPSGIIGLIESDIDSMSGARGNSH
jgi:hypothetical protein